MVLEPSPSTDYWRLAKEKGKEGVTELVMPKSKGRKLDAEKGFITGKKTISSEARGKFVPLSELK